MKSIILTLVVLFTAGVFTAEAAKITTIGTKPKVGNGNSGSPYEIRSAEEFRWFVHYENTRHWFPDDYAKLMCDIDLSTVCGPEIGSWIPLGGYNEEEGAKTFWNGHLDGNGCTISGLYIDADDYDYRESYSYHVSLGLIGEASSSFEVKNLTVEGEIEKVNYCQYVGGLVGYIQSGSGKVENCVSHVKITDLKDVDRMSVAKYIGGLVGFIEKGARPTIQNCAYSGELDGETGVGDGVQTAGLIGCEYGATVSGPSRYTHVLNCSSYTGGKYPLIGRGHAGMEIKNCITDHAIMNYLGKIEEDATPADIENNRYVIDYNGNLWKSADVPPHPQPSGNQAVTAEDLASGKVCYELSTGSYRYYQKLGTDPIPYPIGSHGTVYKVKKYSTCRKYEYVYSNDPDDITDNLVHNFFPYLEICPYCAAAPNPEWFLKEQDDDGFYRIGTAEDFKKFAEMVNENVFKIDVRLTADIDLGGEAIVPLKEYSGELDGAGHTISNFRLYTSEFARDGGLVGCLQGKGKIHDLTLSGFIFAQPNTNIGAFAGRVKQGCELRNLRNDCMVVVQGSVYSGQSEMNIGGIVGLLEGTAECCINNGQVLDTSQKVNYSATIRMGGLVGFAKATATMNKLVNNAFVGSNSFSAVWGDAIAYCEAETNAPTQSYYVNDFERSGINYFFSNSSTCATAVTKDQLGSGEVCYLLNDSQSPDVATPVFGQKIGTDVVPYPYVTTAHPGVYNTRYYYNCTDYSNYSNYAENGTARDHVFTTHHYCDKCFVIDNTIDKVDGVYQITSTEDYNLFAQAINAADDAGKAMQFASAALTKDIVLSGESFTTINMLRGTLNGQGKTITIAVTSDTQKQRKLIGSLTYTGSITFLNLKGVYSVTETGNEVVLVDVNCNTVSNCSAIDAMLQYGNCASTIIDCYSNRTPVGSNPGTMERVLIKEADGSYTLYNGYGFSGNEAGKRTFTAEDAQSGKLAYYISHIDPKQPCVWGQDLSYGGDSEPRIYLNQTPKSATFVTYKTFYSINDKEGNPSYTNAGTPNPPGPGYYQIFSDGDSWTGNYLSLANNIVDNGDGTYSAKHINLDPTAQHYLPIEVEAKNFTIDKECTEGEFVSLVLPVDMPISSINGTVYLFEGMKLGEYDKKYFSFTSDLDMDVIPANTPMVVKAKEGNILKEPLQNVHVYPMTGSHSITADFIPSEGAEAMPVTHYVSYQNETLDKFYGSDKIVYFSWTPGAERAVPYQGAKPTEVGPLTTFFTVENTVNITSNLEVHFNDPATTLAAVPNVLNSICPEHDGILTAAEGATLNIYVFAGIHDGYVYGIPATEEYYTPEGHICAGVPYIFVTDGESVTFERSFRDYDYERYVTYGRFDSKYRACKRNGLQGVLLDGGAQLKGHDYIVFTRNGLKYAPTGQYTEGEKEGQDKTVTVGRGKCFIDNSKPAPAQAQARRIGAFNEGTTGIEELTIDQMTIDNCYNLSGQRVGSAYKGIVIQNGKKLLRK